MISSLPNDDILEYTRGLLDDLGHAGQSSVRRCPSDEDMKEIFHAVSLRREMDTGRLDVHGRFDESAISWDVDDPWVNRMVQGFPKDRTPGTGGKGVSPLRVIVTHDVDRVSPLEPLSLLKAARGTIHARSGWLRFADAVKPRLFLENLERMLDLELQHGVRPWFFMLAGRYGLGRYSNRYGIRWRAARDTIRLIQEAGGEIGLHGSYHARERDSYDREARLLAEVVGRPVRAHRNHYLRFDPRRIWHQLDGAGIDVDFSLCLGTRMGFRVPLTGPFRPFDWRTKRASNVWAVPTIAMDKWWWPAESERILAQLERLLKNARDVGGTVAILVHPEVFGIDRGWFDLFEKIIVLARGLGARLDTGREELINEGVS